MNIAVIGLGFGDEGKGCTVDWLCSQYPNSSIIRYSGGHQAGHHVLHKEILTEHVFSNFGSGTLRNCPTFWMKYCTVNPVGLKKEYYTLVNKGYTPKIIIHRECPIVTPLDKRANQDNIVTLTHGSCGVGFYETLKRNKNNFTLQVEDLSCEKIFKAKYEAIANWYYNVPVDLILEQEFYDACTWMYNTVDFYPTYNTHMSCNFIYESSQGLLLDKDIGIFPHCTPSNVGFKALSDNFIHEVYYVTRGYQTRHGAGFMTDNYIELSADFDKTNKNNEYQGQMRFSMLDLDLLEYGLMKDSKYRHKETKLNLIITCLEHLHEYKFHYKGEIIKCKSEKIFCQEIAKVLSIPNVYMCKEYEFNKLGE